MKWFGDNWGAPVCDEKTHVETPTNAQCTYCSEPIEKDDRGVLIPYIGSDVHIPYHIDCLLKTVLGD